MSQDHVSGEIRVTAVEARDSVRIPQVDSRQLALLLEQMQQLVGMAGGQQQGKTFGEMAKSWWMSLDRVWPEKERNRFELLRCFWGLRETDLSIRRVNGVLTGFHKGGYSGSYVNKIRNTGKLIVEAAIEEKEWRGPNPFAKSKRARQTKPDSRSVTILEARAFLPHLREDRFWLAFTMLSVGLRPGEMLGLKKCDVDLDRKTLLVRRSHGRDETKTGAERTIYLPDELAPVLRYAMERSPSKEFVFGHPDGGQWRADTKLSRALQHAFRKAGMCTGYDYSCRRRSCGFRDSQETLEDRRCPRCDFKLWSHGRPKTIRFYDLRHSCATLHKEAGCDPWVVERTLGHSQGITGREYTHCSPEFQRRELNKLSLLGKQPDPTDSNRIGKHFLTAGVNGDLQGDAETQLSQDVRFTPMSTAPSDAREAGLEPTTLGLEGRRSKVETTPPKYLTADQAAAEAQLSPNYIRALVRNGILPAARFGQRMRIKREDLIAFIEGGGRPGASVAKTNPSDS